MHVAIIMDGNGRWAQARGFPRIAGHRAGVEAARRIVEAAPGLGIGTLSLFAFSADNWRRPPEEVGALMDLMRAYLRGEVRRLLENGVKLQVIGRRDRLSRDLVKAVEEAEGKTAAGASLRLRIAVDYSARDSIVRAANVLNGSLSRETLAAALAPEVDLLIRTGGEQRLSDFLLWECAYAELVFARPMWPDFSPGDLSAALRQFHNRERRFGAVPPVPAARAGAWLD